MMGLWHNHPPRKQKGASQDSPPFVGELGVGLALNVDGAAPLGWVLLFTLCCITLGSALFKWSHR